jgi:hypothetical protein
MGYTILKGLMFAMGLTGTGFCIAQAQAWGHSSPPAAANGSRGDAVAAPELSSHAGATGATVLLGAAAMLASRRRSA